MSYPDVAETTRTVRAQYEDLPYPFRDPADERKRFLFTPLDDLPALNHYCFGGRRDFRSGFRALVAGAGTGDSTIHLAEQLKGTDATLVHLDLSRASIEVAAKRAQVRGLDNIIWIQGSLLDLPGSDLEPFDYINCSGVLHHLNDPPAGLHALRTMLKEGGAMGLMLYGTYGRTGVYQMQELLRHINHAETDSARKVANTRKLVDQLPESNWFKRSEDMFSAQQSCDVELYDLLLHSTDRPYTVPEVYEFLNREGLDVVEFLPGMRALYDPNLAFQDPELRERILKLPVPRQQAAAELFWGAVKKHDFWASTKKNPVADFDAGDNVPFFSRMAKLKDVPETIRSEQTSVWSMNVLCVGDITLNITLELDAVARRFLALIDDRRTMGEILVALATEFHGNHSSGEIQQKCRTVFESLRSYDLLLLRHVSLASMLRAA
jgi:ubiquinone/menaquinone biosynthesis C-methylase UbiE